MHGHEQTTLVLMAPQDETTTLEQKAESGTGEAAGSVDLNSTSQRPTRRVKRGNDTSNMPEGPRATKVPRLENKSDNKKRDDPDDMNWTCALCKEAECLMEPNADQFLICDGLCRRVFHYPCAGLSQIPDSDEDWICKDCTQSRHQCAFCQEYGNDHVDVFPCRKDTCGLFFHESCLEWNNVPVKMERTASEGDKMANNIGIPIFTCPAHHCWTCTQEDALKKEREEADAKKKEGGKKVKRSKKKSIYICKTEGRLYRCLYCPSAYHVTCLPPTCKVNELGILCPEHSLSHKLPDVDESTSLQKYVEEQIDRKIERINGQSRARRLLNGGRGATSNAFFPGLRGDRLLRSEQDYLDHLTKNPQDDQAKDEGTGKEGGGVYINKAISAAIGRGLAFCLPIDIKSEVHSKPPNYTHVHALRYDTNHRPKRIPATGEQCQCVDDCDSHCYNRMSLVECCGEGPNSNCRLGPEKCSNRALGKRQFVKCKPQRESGKGWGLVTLEPIPKGKLVQEYVGEVIDETEKERRLIEWSKEHPNDPNFYIMGLGSGWYVDAREYANLSRFINHSCDPNCQVTTINVKGYNRNGIYAIRNIQAGEFLCYDYHFDTKQGDKFLCRCGAKNCRGTMQGKGGLQESKKPLTWKDAKTRYDNDVKQLAQLNQMQVSSQVSALIPAAEFPTDLVSSGPPEKHKDLAVENSIFLWRNAVRGADFAVRYARIQSRRTDQDVVVSKPTTKLSEELISSNPVQVSIDMSQG